jgi:hypothetical protein
MERALRGRFGQRRKMSQKDSAFQRWRRKRPHLQLKREKSLFLLNK